MSYSAEISRQNPTCILFLIDQSGSMADPIGGASGRSKAQGVADAINRFLFEIVFRCSKGDTVSDYFHIGVIGYGGGKVGPAFTGKLAGREIVPLSEVASNPARIEDRSKKVEDGAGGLVEEKIKFAIWFDPVHDGDTPMCEALKLARKIIEGWIKEHPNCFPPIVINITDGEATDGETNLVENLAKDIKNLKSEDGEVLMFNLHLSSQKGDAIKFPDREDNLPDSFAKLLFRMSSTFTENMICEAKSKGYNVSNNSKGFVFNADIVDVIDFLDIGTRAGKVGR